MWEFGILLLNRCGPLRAAVPALLAALAVRLALAQYRQGAIAALVLSLYLSVALQRCWRVRQQPGDFTSHCQLLEQLLNGIEHMELRLLRGQPSLQGLTQACRELEDLAQLRGLAVRGAQQPCCPLPLQVQMRYLSQRLQLKASRQFALGAALQQLRRELIEPSRVAISPTACFALLTPLIDERLGLLREQLG